MPFPILLMRAHDPSATIFIISLVTCLLAIVPACRHEQNVTENITENITVREGEGDLATSLREATRWVVFDTPIIVQDRYSSTKERSIVFLPVVPLERQPGEPRVEAHWRIEITFPRSNRGSPSVSVINGDLIEKPTSERIAENLSKALLVSSSHLEQVNLLNLPVILRVTPTESGYRVHFTYLPEKPGAYIDVLVSREFEVLRVIGGE